MTVNGKSTARVLAENSLEQLVAGLISAGHESPRSRGSSPHPWLVTLLNFAGTIQGTYPVRHSEFGLDMKELHSLRIVRNSRSMISVEPELSARVSLDKFNECGHGFALVDELQTPPPPRGSRLAVMSSKDCDTVPCMTATGVHGT